MRSAFIPACVCNEREAEVQESRRLARTLTERYGSGYWGLDPLPNLACWKVWVTMRVHDPRKSFVDQAQTYEYLGASPCEAMRNVLREAPRPAIDVQAERTAAHAR